MQNQTKHGKCLCGACRFSATPVDNKIGACHCTTCRTWGGGPFLSVACGTTVTFNDGAPIQVFDSSPWAERGFCHQCGSHLFYRLKSDGLYFMLAGIFDSLGEAEFDHQVFIDQKPPYYTFANRTHDMTGAEMFAKFAPPE